MSYEARRLYVDLLIRCIGNTIYGDKPVEETLRRFSVLGSSKKNIDFDAEKRRVGQDWPSVAHSMAGLERLRNVADLVQRAIDEGVPGDFIETGVWRGGSSILMRGVLAANEIHDRRVYAADSFEGLPKPDTKAYPQDKGARYHEYEALAVSVDQVKANFDAYGLLDDQAVFVKGFFSDTLPGLDAGPFALIRLDGDMYESTIVALDALYPKVSPGGFIIVDDYGAVSACKDAVHHYRQKHGVSDEIHTIDWTGVWWRKPW
jgi:hypothetical protein